MARQGEGSLKAPTRHPLAWQTDEFYDESSLVQELERVFDTCHGCRRCFNLCNAFPTLFDAVDESDTGELDSVDRKVYWKVVDHCYLCDMCFMSIWAIANDDLERSTDEKTSTSEMVQTLKGGRLLRSASSISVTAIRSTRFRRLCRRHLPQISTDRPERDFRYNGTQCYVDQSKE